MTVNPAPAPSPEAYAKRVTAVRENVERAGRDPQGDHRSRSGLRGRRRDAGRTLRPARFLGGSEVTLDVWTSDTVRWQLGMFCELKGRKGPGA